MFRNTWDFFGLPGGFWTPQGQKRDKKYSRGVKTFGISEIFLGYWNNLFDSRTFRDDKMFYCVSWILFVPPEKVRTRCTVFDIFVLFSYFEIFSKCFETNFRIFWVQFLSQLSLYLLISLVVILFLPSTATDRRRAFSWILVADWLPLKQRPYLSWGRVKDVISTTQPQCKLCLFFGRSHLVTIILKNINCD